MAAPDFVTPILLTSLAGASTGIGAAIPLFFRQVENKVLYFMLGLSAGVMIYVSFAELLATAVRDIGFSRANLFFFGGLLFMLVVDFLIPHDYLEEHARRHHGPHGKVMAAGLFAALGIAIHNFPEGMAVFMSSLTNPSLGIALAVAIGMHNIPEGIAVSMPIYYATKSKSKAFWYSFLSGILEPLGAIIALVLLHPFLTPAIISGILAFVAGIMIYISFDELLPLSMGEDKGHSSVAGVFLGMVLMALSLYLLNAA